MASHSGQMSNRSAPTRPPKPKKSQKERGNSSSTNSNVTPDHKLPTYEEIIPGSSNNVPMRESEGDPPIQEVVSDSKARHSKSARKTSAQRTRPEITIISSQPMRNHPAFADGSKGSCVPPEAPPSYDEATKDTSPKHASASQSSNLEHIADRGENGGTRTAYTISGTTLHARREITPTTHSDLNFMTSISNTFVPEQHSTVGLMPVSSNSRDCNRSQNESSHASFGAARSINAVTPHSRTSSSFDSSRQTLSQVTSTASSPSIIKSPNSTSRQTVKPPIPPKKHGLAVAVANHRNEALRDNSQTIQLSRNSTLSETRSLTHSNVTNGNPVAAARKLPPLPPPHITPKQAATPPPHVRGPGFSSVVDEDSLYSSIKEPVNKRMEKLGQVSDGVEETPVKDCPKAAPNHNDETTGKLCAMKTYEDPVEAPEPTYASVRKSVSQKKPTPLVKPRHQSRATAASQEYEVVEVEHTTSDKPATQPLPPPIPESRPPPEDYEGIFSTVASDSNVSKDLLEDQSVVRAIGEVFSTDIIKTNDNPNPVERTKPQGEVNKAYDRIDKLPGEPGRADASNSASDASLNESTYEQIIYSSSASHDVSERSKPIPAARVRHPPCNSMLKPPPLPPAPRSDNLTKKTLLPGNNAFNQQEEFPSKDINSRRKAHTIKEKSGKSYASHGNEFTADKSAGAKANSTSAPMQASKSKSFSFSHYKKRSGSQMNPKVKASSKSSNLSRNQSECSTRNGKPKRVPPPRPPLPLIMQNKALSLKRELHQNEATSTSPSPMLAPQNENPQLHSTVVQHYSHPKPVQPNFPIQSSQQLFPSPKPRVRNQASASLNKNVEVTFEDRTLSSTGVIRSSKPARPPLMKTLPGRANNPHKPNVNDMKDGTETEESFFDVIKNTSESNETNFTVDQQMKHYMANETWYVATHDYQPPNFTDLSFSAGERILVLKQIADELFFGRNKEGIEGQFPSKYVSLESVKKPVTESPNFSRNKTTNAETNRCPNNDSNNKENYSVLGKAIALDDYKSRDKNDLNFNAGNEIEVIGNIGSEWLKGRIGHNVGIFPRNLVSFTPSRVNIGRDSGPTAQTNKKFATALYEFTSIHDNELSLSVDDHIEVICRIDDEWLQGKKQGKVGIFPSAFVDLSSANSALEQNLSSSLIGNVSDNTENSKSVSNEHKSVESKKDADPLGFAVALYGFIGQNDTELTFNGHDVITITEKVNDEWFVGKVNDKTGMFPANFVKITHMDKEQL